MFTLDDFLNPRPTVSGMNEVLENAKEQGHDINRNRRVLPAAIVFSDADKNGRGEKWRTFLKSKGYKVLRQRIGVNPKTGRNISLYTWYLKKAE